MASLIVPKNLLGSCTLKSKSPIIYLPGNEGSAIFSAAFPKGSTNNSQQLIGLLDDKNGWAIGYNNTQFSIMYRNNTIETIIPITEFDKDKLDGNGNSKINLNPNFLNIFKIEFGWLSPVTFSILSKNNVWHEFHTINRSIEESEDDISILNYVPSMCSFVKKSTESSDEICLKTSFWSGFTTGNSDSLQVNNFGKSTLDVNLPTRENVHILTIKNKSSINNIANQTILKLMYLGMFSLSQSLVKFKLIRNGNIIKNTGELTWTDKDNRKSFVEYCENADLVSGGSLEFASAVDSVSGPHLFLKTNDIDITLLPGETISVIANAKYSTKLDCNLFWREELN